MKRLRLLLICFGGLFCALLLFLFVGISKIQKDTQYGVTWSAPYAASLGVNPEEGLRAVLEDLGVKRFRIPVYWSRVEARKGIFDWKELDQEIRLIAAHGGKVILALGAKQPRWPEYWIPSWVLQLNPEEQKKAQFSYGEAALSHFAKQEAVEAWQIENESQFGFGIGKPQSMEFIKQEMAIANFFGRVSPRKQRRTISTTDSGELSLWFGFKDHIDQLGISVYRVVVHPKIGVVRYSFLPPYFYYRKWLLLHTFFRVPRFYVSEFQMEPWGTKPLPELSLAEQFNTFDPLQMKKNFAYAEKMVIPERRLYFWGAEWWYWMKELKKHPEFWLLAKDFFAEH